MGLTSDLFRWVVVCVAGAFMLGTVWLWPRLARQRIPQIAARIGLVAAGQALLLAALLVNLNDSLAFFDSWSTLLGTGQQYQFLTPAQARAARALAMPVDITATSIGSDFTGGTLTSAAAGGLARGVPWIAPATSPVGPRARAAATSGAVLEITIHGVHSGISQPGDYVYLPPQYFQSAFARSRFPVIMTFTGYPNVTSNLMRLLRLPQTAARLTASGRTRPAVVLMLNPSVALPRDTECTNIPGGLQVATFFARDVPQAIERTFRVQQQPSGWATMGYSTGGYCAAKLAMLYPSQFSAAVALSGYFNAGRDRTTGDLYGGSPAYRNENNLYWRLRHMPAPPVSVLVAASTGEGALHGTLAFLHLIRPPMRGYSLILSQGGHNYFTWHRELRQSMEWLSARLTPAVPARSAKPQTRTSRPR